MASVSGGYKWTCTSLLGIYYGYCANYLAEHYHLSTAAGMSVWPMIKYLMLFTF